MPINGRLISSDVLMLRSGTRLLTFRSITPFVRHLNNLSIQHLKWTPNKPQSWFSCRRIDCWKTNAGIDLLSSYSTLHVEDFENTVTPTIQFPVFEEWKQDPLLMSCCEVKQPLRIAVLLSGGVDSSVALALLKAAGHDIRAFYLRIWFQEDFENFWSSCPWEEDLDFAQQVCDQLEVPLEVVSLTTEYWDRVAAETIAEIKSGRTPNPDVWCNSRIKFGAFLDFLESQDRLFDRVASGHYGKVTRSFDSAGQEKVELSLSKDKFKDQTYFLARLNVQQLSKCIFPLGNLLKSEVRELAAIAKLPTMKRKDSQGICFLGKVKFNEFVERHLGKWPGPILEEETQQKLGQHDGYWFHTIGQRKGLRLGGGPWYVTRKDIAENVVYVSRRSADTLDSDDMHLFDTFICRDLHWFQEVPDCVKLDCKVRHGEHLYKSRVVDRSPHSWKIQLNAKDQGLASGQFAVFYRDGLCLGSGVIDSPAVIHK